MGIFNTVLNAMIVTIFIAFTATATAIPLAFVLSFLASRNLMAFNPVAKFVYAALRFVFNFTRSVEPLIWAIIFSVWVGIGPFAGMMALMLHSIASLAKLYSEAIEGVDRGPMEAIEATGGNRVHVVWYAVVPQIILPFLSFTIYRWDINIHMATIIGLVGGGGVGTLLMQYQGLAKWNEVGTIILTIAVVVWLMDYVSAKIREAIY
jgi:phosphonate transport system permease protein